MTESLWRPSASISNLKERARVLAAVRSYFLKERVMEVDTPALSRSATVDPFIESFKTGYTPEGGVEVEAHYYLHTSPEFAMKRLLAAGSGDIYFLGHVFRNGEQSRRHNSEFCMLEWYRVDFDYHQLMKDVANLLSEVAGVSECEYVAYRSLFEQYMGVNPNAASREQLLELVHEKVDPSLDGLSRNDCLDLLFSYHIEPKLGRAQGGQLKACFVYDYPESMSALAQVAVNADGEMVAQRFEVFVAGCELANGYQELTDANEQAERFTSAQEERKQLGRVIPPSDGLLVDAISAGLPNCSGVALGVDRLLMLMLSAGSLAEVLPFSFERA